MDSARLFPSAIVCSCGERFDSNWNSNNNLHNANSALWLYLAHKASALASSSTQTLMTMKPHRLIDTFVSCIHCLQSLSIDHYRSHLDQCQRVDDGERLAIEKYRQLYADRFLTASFECALCVNDDRFYRLDVGTMLEHRHKADDDGSAADAAARMELYVTCRVCSSGVAVDNALEHAAFAHQLSTSAADVADMFFTAPRMPTLVRNSFRTDNEAFSPIEHDEMPAFEPNHRDGQSFERHQQPLASYGEVRNVKRVPPIEPIVDNQQSHATLDCTTSQYLTEEIFDAQSIDAWGEIGAEPTSAQLCLNIDAMSQAPSQSTTGSRCEVALQNARQPISTGAPSDSVHGRRLRILGVRSSPSANPQQSRHRIGRGLHECDECGQTFVTRPSLTTHQRWHTGELPKKEVVPYECENRGRSCSTSRSVGQHGQTHMDASHDAELHIFECDECGKGFRQSATLAGHRLVHTGERPFGCSDCGKRFRLSTTLAGHRLVHTGERPFGCSDCGKHLSSSGSLKLHRRIHTGESPFRCSDCGKHFRLLTTLASHRLIHTGERPFGCSDCGKRFSQISNRNRHRLVVHMGERRYVCSDCGKRFSNKKSLATHQCKHTGEFPYECENCGRSYSTLRSLEQHGRNKHRLVVHMGERYYPYVCSDCGKRFSYKNGLATHQRKHTGELPKKEVVLYECENCGRKCTNLKVHQRIHTGECPIDCSDCGKHFGRSEKVSQHRLVHTGERSTCICPDCGKHLSSSSSLKIHRRIHTGERPYGCSDCGKRFRLSTTLASHRLIHTGERPFGCSDCGKRFSQLSNRNKHRLVVHMGERPYVCPDCGKCFSEKNSLTQHWTIHTGDRPFGCSDCGKHFRLLSILTNHRRIHTSERPFGCSDCGVHFRLPRSLQKHRIVHTRERPFGCSDCGMHFGRSDKLSEHRRNEHTN